jgi:hypothetical protein
LSVDAVHDVAIELTVTLVAAKPVGDDGDVVSGHAAVAAVIDWRAEMLPAASNASTPSA